MYLLQFKLNKAKELLAGCTPELYYKRYLVHFGHLRLSHSKHYFELRWEDRTCSNAVLLAVRMVTELEVS